MTLAVVLSFVALAALAVLALLWSPWPRWLKALLVAAVTVFYFWADEAVHQMWGWPSTDALPERFVLLAAVIEEPTSKSAGALYVWVQALENGKPSKAPRAYQLPYAKDLHALLNEGIK
jgi:hypothetical protein